MSDRISHEEVRESLTGPLASLRVPFDRDGAIDYGGLANLIDRIINVGSNTVLLTYGDSLFSVLTDDEVAEVTKFVVQHTAGRAMVTAADRQWWTGKEVEFAKYACDADVDVLMVLPPNWAASCTSEALVAHYAAVAEHIPVMLVTNIFRGVEAQGLQTLEKVRDEVEGVVAVKDDIGGVFAHKLCALVGEVWAVFSGGTLQGHMDMAPYGCDGFMSSFLYFRPSVDQNYWRAMQSNDWAGASEIVREYDIPFTDFRATLDGGRNSAIHGVFELFGLSERWRRPPYHSLTDEEMERLRAFFISQGWA